MHVLELRETAPMVSSSSPNFILLHENCQKIEKVAKFLTLGLRYPPICLSGPNIITTRQWTMRCDLPDQISPSLVYTIAPADQKTPTFWSKFEICGLLYLTPIADHGQICHARVNRSHTLRCQILHWSVYPRPCGAKNLHFHQILNFVANCGHHSPIRAKFDMQTHGTRFRAKFRRDPFSVALEGYNPQIWPYMYFQIIILCGAT